MNRYRVVLTVDKVSGHREVEAVSAEEAAVLAVAEVRREMPQGVGKAVAVSRVIDLGPLVKLVKVEKGGEAALAEQWAQARRERRKRWELIATIVAAILIAHVVIYVVGGILESAIAYPWLVPGVGPGVGPREFPSRLR
jgi:hypothetical protein